MTNIEILKREFPSKPVKWLQGFDAGYCRALNELPPQSDLFGDDYIKGYKAGYKQGVENFAF